jgi:hypothetical protein
MTDHSKNYWDKEFKRCVIILVWKILFGGAEVLISTPFQFKFTFKTLSDVRHVGEYTQLLCPTPSLSPKCKMLCGEFMQIFISFALKLLKSVFSSITLVGNTTLLKL